jgi:NAD dependent epimerase/dehydratase family enzyme
LCTCRSRELRIIYVVASSGGAQEKRKDRMKLSLPTKIGGGREKLVWVPVIELKGFWPLDNNKFIIFLCEDFLIL